MITLISSNNIYCLEKEVNVHLLIYVNKIVKMFHKLKILYNILVMLLSCVHVHVCGFLYAPKIISMCKFSHVRVSVVLKM